MKTLLFVWSGLKVGGSESALVTLTKHLEKFYNINILCHQNIIEYELLPEINVYNIKTAPANLIGQLLDKLYLFHSIFVRSKKVEVIITNEFPLLVIFSYFVAKLRGKKIIVWNHSCRNEIRLSKNKLIELVYKHVLRKVSHIVSVSFYAQRSLKEYLHVVAANSVIYNMVDNSRYLSLKPTIVNDSSFFQVIAQGSLSPVKNFELLINAVSVLVNDHKRKIRVTICGEGSERNKLEQQICNLDLQETVHLSGKVDNPLEYINNCDLVVSVSNSESFSLVILDALVLGKPVISTNTGAAEVLGNGKFGIIVDKNDRDQLVDAILKAMDDNALMESMLMRYKDALKKFESSQLIRHWNLLLEKVIVDNNDFEISDK